MAGKVLPLAGGGAAGMRCCRLHHQATLTSASSLPHSTMYKRVRSAAGRWGSSSTTCRRHGKLQEQRDQLVHGRQRVHHREPWHSDARTRRCESRPVLAGQGAPPDPGVPPLPPLPIAAIPLPDGMAAPLAAFGAVPVGLFG